MLMCETCFELYSEENNISVCPKINCDHSQLVHLDDEIAFYISKINKLFLQYDIPFRTIFCCSSHAFEFENTQQPYIGFKLVNLYKFINEKECQNICFSFIKYIQPLVDELNHNVSKLFQIKEYSLFKGEYSLNPTLNNISGSSYIDDDDICGGIHRVFINDFSYTLSILPEEKPKDEYQRFLLLTQLDLEMVFRKFLINLIYHVTKEKFNI